MSRFTTETKRKPRLNKVLVLLFTNIGSSVCLAANNVPVKLKLQHPPRATPGHLNFWKIFVQIPPSPLPPPARAFGEGAGAYFTDSGW